MSTQIGKDIEKAAALLKDSSLVAIPTETVYGLAANALDESAVAEIFRVKNRPTFDPLILHVADVEGVKKYSIDCPIPLLDFFEKNTPGPVTIILPKTDDVPFLTTSGLKTAAFRIPQHPMTLELLARLEFPLAAPSANPFGYISPTSAQHVMDQLGGAIPYILDGGPCSVGIESTIIEYWQGRVIVHRLGGMSLDTLKEHFEMVDLKVNRSSNPLAPGQLKSHYAPKKSLYCGDIETLYRAHEAEKPALILFSDKIPGLDPESQFVLSDSGSTKEAAQKIFGLLRELDQSNFGVIIAELLPEVELGPAVNDRLKRAAAKA